MTIGDDFRSDAQEIIKDFCEELGKGSLIVTNTKYNTTSGVDEDVTPPVVTPVYIAFDEIKSGYDVSDLGAEYTNEHMLAMIAGADLAAPPEKGNFVQRPGSTDKHRIVLVPTDMYGALYSCHVTRSVE